MTTWPLWLLVAILTIAALLLIGGGQITTGPRMNRRSDQYDPVYLRQQEIMESRESSRRQEPRND